jgi:hypothetical protein
MSEYDELIERGAARLAGWITNPTPEREAHMWDVVVEAVRLRSGRADDLAPREDWVAVMFDVVEAVCIGVKKRLIERLPGKLGVGPGEIARVLDLEMAQLMTRHEIEQMLDAHLPRR